MKVDRSDLESKILLVLKDVDRNVLAKVQKFMLSKGITSGRTMGIINKTTPIQIVPDIELCLLTQALYKYAEEPVLSPDKYFNDRELKEAENFKIDLEDKKTNVMVFHNVFRIGEYQWICAYETYKNIDKYFKNGNITYNFVTQRNTVKKDVGGDIVEFANINKAAVREISKKMLEGTFVPNAITLNIRKTGGEKFEYDEKEKTLMIEVDNDESFCDIIDGMHRSGGIIRSLQIDENLQGVTIVNITNFTEDEAQNFIVQEDKRTPIAKSLLATFDKEDTDMLMAKEINKEGNARTNEMFNRMVVDDKDLLISNAYTTFNIVANAIKYSFKYDSVRESRKIKEFIIKGMNEIIGILKDKGLDDSKINRNNTVAYEPNIFIGYILLLSKLYGHNNWEYQLELIISNIDYGRDNQTWHSIGLFNKNINKPTIKKIGTYFEELLMNVAV